MIKIHELNDVTRSYLKGFSVDEVCRILDMATDVMTAIEQRSGQARLGENGSVEVVIKMMLFLEKGELTA